MGWLIDDPRLQLITPIQWDYYMRNLVMDEAEMFERARDLVEYGAMFWNAEGVQKVRDARKLGKGPVEADVPMDDTLDAIRSGQFD